MIDNIGHIGSIHNISNECNRIYIEGSRYPSGMEEDMDSPDGRLRWARGLDREANVIEAALLALAAWATVDKVDTFTGEPNLSATLVSDGNTVEIICVPKAGDVLLMVTPSWRMPFDKAFPIITYRIGGGEAMSTEARQRKSRFTILPPHAGGIASGMAENKEIRLRLLGGEPMGDITIAPAEKTAELSRVLEKCREK